MSASSPSTEVWAFWHNICTWVPAKPDRLVVIPKGQVHTSVFSLTINGRLYDGSWRAEYVFDALCASLIKKPEVCFKMGIQREEGLSGPIVFIIIIIVLAINIILFILCKNLIKKKIMDRIESIDINSRIDDAVNTYFALKDNPSD